MFINDVGQGTWEEINDGARRRELRVAGHRRRDHRSAIRHAALQLRAQRAARCAIVGGAFYAPMTAQFPGDYLNDYFFADYCAGWIRRIDPANGNAIEHFRHRHQLAGRPEGRRRRQPVLPDARVGGAVYRVVLRRHRADHHLAAVEPDGRARDAGHLQRAGIGPGTAALSVAAQRREHRRRDRAGLHDRRRRQPPTTARGSAPWCRMTSAARTSAEAVLTVTSNQAPTATITAPAAGALYSGGTSDQLRGHRHRSGGRHAAGERLHLAGGLPPRYAHRTRSWRRRAVRPSGTFTIPTTGETAANVWYRIYLTVRDAAGATHTVAARPPSAQGLPHAGHQPAPACRSGSTASRSPTPLTFDAVVGIVRSLDAPTPQSSGTTSYEFASWSDGGAAAHTISTPSANTTYTATYRPGGSSGSGTGLNADVLRQRRLHRDAVRTRSTRPSISPGAPARRPARSASTPSARAGPVRSKRPTPAPTRSTRRATTACGCG